MLVDQPSDDDIREAANAFRLAINLAGPEPWKAKYITFPRGACGHAAELLAYYLHQRFGITPDYISQTTYENDVGGWKGGHAWLEWNGLTIDVSGDQFGWPAVIVTREPIFHGRGEDEQRFPALADMQWWSRECGSLWAAIAPHLNPPVFTTNRN